MNCIKVKSFYYTKDSRNHRLYRKFSNHRADKGRKSRMCKDHSNFKEQFTFVKQATELNRNFTKEDTMANKHLKIC